MTPRRGAGNEKAITELSEDLQGVIVLTARFAEDDYERVARKLFQLGWRKIKPPPSASDKRYITGEELAERALETYRPVDPQTGADVYLPSATDKKGRRL